MILEEYDESKKSTFEPTDVEEKIEGFPKIGISCFSKKLFDSFLKKQDYKEIGKTTTANGETPIYKIEYEGKEYALYMSLVGAPACTVQYEELLAKGMEKLVICGTCGVLDKNIEDLAIIIPNSAYRDEGTSYHYLPSSREIEINKKYKEDFIEILKEYNYSYVEGKVWTTDAPYRETKDKVLKRKKEGCICVEMECASLNAVAKFRNKDIFQFFYAADNLDNAKWDKRSLGNEDKLTEKEKVLLLALKLASKM